MEMELFISTSSSFISSLSICIWRSGRSILVFRPHQSTTKLPLVFLHGHRGMSMKCVWIFNHIMSYYIDRDKIDRIISILTSHSSNPFVHDDPDTGVLLLDLLPIGRIYDASNCTSTPSNDSYTQYYPRVMTIHISYWWRWWGGLVIMSTAVEREQSTENSDEQQHQQPTRGERLLLDWLLRQHFHRPMAVKLRTTQQLNTVRSSHPLHRRKED